MRSRWFHKPTLHRAGLEKRVTWLEIFFDLIFAASFLELGGRLSGGGSGLAGVALVFIPLWVVWTGAAFFSNRYTVDDFLYRMTVLGMMFAVGAMAVFAADVAGGRPAAFAWSCSAAQAFIAALYLRGFKQVPEARDYGRYWGMVFAVGSGFWLASGFVPAPWCFVLWGVGLIEVFAAPFRKYSRELNQRFPWDERHLTERYGLLTLIVLGGVFVKVLAELARSGHPSAALFESSFILIIVASVWWIYFDDVAGSRIRRGRVSSLLWLYGHLPLLFGIVAVGAAVNAAVGFELSRPAPDGSRWLLCGSLAIVLGAVALIDSVTERRQAELSDALRVKFRGASAVLMLLLAPAGRGMSSLTFVSLVGVVCVVQVVFDMLMAPFENAEEAKEIQTLADEARASDGAPQNTRPRAELSETVRLGAPDNLRRDIYFYFMEGTWGRLIVAYVGLFLLLNLFFAALYAIEPGSIHGGQSQSFSDAFFFSVQTMSTIGYGAMSPATDYGHTLVTVEAAVSIFITALITGLMFAKASRPKSSVLFSKRMVVTEMDGVRTLVFRVGNARGNEVVDASMTVTVVTDYLSPEGHHLRRLRDLPLVRARTPLFVLSWTAMHVLDQNSPLVDIDWDNPDETIVAIIVTLTGHDGTYNATIYARHMYYPETIHAGHRFVDVVSQLEDGRLVIDYTKFHDVAPD